MGSMKRSVIEMLRWAEMTRAQYVSCFSDDGVWHGDTCGCSDDRCEGFHHDENEECNCVEVCIEDAQLMLRRRAWPALDAELIAAEAAHLIRWRELAELPRGAESDAGLRSEYLESARLIRMIGDAARRVSL